ncbi:response regulator [Microcoleus sp. FACHB-831]|uniref:hybrid sensor histidine kinase/response regulator n=1 Tax=Microcoleus sp. FACHB-831 TaxID=2692827 RepID=UPI0016860313|nr:response regulator [Microcoleus sp. FACHB-831]MBD1924371.1 response regulator [Microcoleus sp. FACHB-831]
MRIPLRLLLVEDSEDDAMLLTRELRRGNYDPVYERVDTAAAMSEALDREQWEIVIADYAMPQFSGISALQVLQQKQLDLPFIIVSGTIGEDVAVGAMKAGAHDYMNKDNLARLVPAVERELREAKVRQERIVAQEQIREQAALLDVAQDAIIVQDLEDRICFWNKSAERLYGWTSQEVIGKKAAELLFADPTATLHLTPHPSLLTRKGEWQGELDQVTKEGEEIIVESRWRLMRDGSGQPKSVLVVNTDITEKKKLEIQFLRTQRLESIGTLAGGIAHDLNNVLAPILMGLEIIKMKLPDPESQKVLATLEASTKRGADIVRQVLAFARGLEGRHAELQVKHLVREIAHMAQETFPKYIDIRVEIPVTPWVILGDATQLQQVLLNLCVNARDAMPNGGKLLIRAENVRLDENYARMHLEAKPGIYVLLTVTDTGMGIPPAIIDKIFEPFFTTKPVGQGTGLGLSTILGIVRSHGGFINVYSDVGKGTSFKVYLPADTKIELEDIEIEHDDMPSGGGELVMVIDDEASIRDIAKQTLETFGYKVITADDGSEAIALYVQQQVKVHVAIVDMKMPIMDGPATIRALRKLDPKVKIIAASGLTLGGQMAEASTVNAQAVLPKPFTAENLLKTIYRVMSSY